ncbi:hypothetical protein ACJIZ3_017440 [Penstemon smallii]|uniref:Kinesin motor domain-containing protein n=1 Tax=Penstemon smallii TaxID=265156 RepID=A0ABD3SVZ3_9LAMI
MPLFSESTTSAIKTRFGLNKSKQPDPAESSAMKVTKSSSSPDLLLKSAARENLLPPSSSYKDKSSKSDDGEMASHGVARSFEFGEDPSFWKDHNVQVIIRVRPLSSSEISVQGNSRCVKQDSSQSITWTGHPESRFTFDIVADENVSQEMLFKVAGVRLVENCMEGYNSCMFAYGQTGSGKTHTMLGDIEGGARRHSVNCGMTPRVFEYLFSRIQKDKDARREEKLKFTCRCSFLEIYNEQIVDLLDPSSANLQIREDTKKGVYVENLTEIEVTSARDVIQQLIQGSANRKVAATNMNRASSRSHSVFTCIIESKWESQGVTHYRFARLNLVDLAGSERQKSSGAEGERLKEATNINKSLSTLGLVIMNLVSMSSGKSLHIPYRDSKLTFLLQDSLGGNAKTIMIANISPSSSCSLETLSTLKFAQRAKFIKNHAIVNEDASGDVLALRIENQNLKKEVSRLRSLANGGAESYDDDVLSVSFPGSPGYFKWDGSHGFSSPLISQKKMSHLQKKEYEVALVGAFRREKDKDTALQALAAQNQAALQLAKQREDEIQGLKMRLRFREAGMKRLEAVASGKISPEIHLLKEKEEYLKEIEVLRAQVDHNQDVTRFAMENLQLKEEIRRLKSFCEEGERERMHEQIIMLENKLLEALDWKLMHESDPANIQKESPEPLMDNQSDINFLSSNQESASPWRTSMNEENEFLRMQAIQHQSELDSLRKKLDFYVEEKGMLERHANDLAKELESERVRKGQTEVLSLMDDHITNTGQSDQTEIKTMVDAIAAASQREAEAHEMAIFLSQENDGLRMKLKELIDDNNKLIDLYEKAAAEIESLKHQITEMHEENDKLLSLYEKAMQERDEFKRVIASGQQKNVDEKKYFSCPEKLVEIDGGQCLRFDEPSVSINDKLGRDEMDSLGPCVHNDLDFENHPVHIIESFLDETCWHEVHVQDGCSPFSILPKTSIYSDSDEPDRQSLAEVVKSDVSEPIAEDIMEIDELKEPEEQEECDRLVENSSVLELDVSVASDECDQNSHMNTMNAAEKSTATVPVDVSKDLNSIRKKLVEAQEKLSYSAQTISMFGSLERAMLEVDTLSEKISKLECGLQAKQQECAHLKTVSSELQERKDLVDKKLLALKNSLKSFSSSVSYFEQREALAKSRLNASSQHLTQRKEELNSLQVSRHQMVDTHLKLKQTEAELKNILESLRSKMEDENRKLESDRVLFAIENVEKTSDHLAQKNWKMSGKATELLKREEEKTKLQNQIKLNREKLVGVREEAETVRMKLGKIDNKMQVMEIELQKEVSLVEELGRKLHSTVQEKEMIFEMNENGKKEVESMIVEYYQSLFEVDLKEEETKIMDDELVAESQKIEGLRRAKAEAAKRKTQLVEAMTRNSSFVSDKMEADLHNIQLSVVELNSLLENCRSIYC